MSFAVTAIYTYYYNDRNTADIYKFFDDSKVLFDAIKTNPIDYLQMLFGIGNDTPYFTEHYYTNMNHWVKSHYSNIYNDSHLITRFNAFIRLFSFGYFAVHNIFINFFSLVGFYALYKAFKKSLKHNELLAFISVCCFPSVLFWSSGLLKEGLVIFIIGTITYHIFKTASTFNLFSFSTLLCSLFLLYFLKFYVFVIISLTIIGFMLNKTLKNKMLLGWFFTFIVFLITINTPYLQVFNIISTKQTDFINLAKQVNAGSYVDINVIHNFHDLIINIPTALLNTFIKPFIWEVKTPFMLLSALQNLLIIILITFSFKYKRKHLSIHKNYIAYTCFFSLGLYIIIGLVTPVYGAISRYLTIPIPFLIIFCFIIIDRNKLNYYLPFLKKI